MKYFIVFSAGWTQLLDYVRDVCVFVFRKPNWRWLWIGFLENKDFYKKFSQNRQKWISIITHIFALIRNFFLFVSTNSQTSSSMLADIILKQHGLCDDDDDGSSLLEELELLLATDVEDELVASFFRNSFSNSFISSLRFDNAKEDISNEMKRNLV